MNRSAPSTPTPFAKHLTPKTLEDGSLSSSLKWTALTALPEVGMSIRVPAGAEVITGTPGATLEPGGSGAPMGPSFDVPFTWDPCYLTVG